MSSETKKLVLVLATSILITITKKKAVKTPKTTRTAKIAKIAEAIETAGTNKDGKKSKGEYLKNFVQLPCIQYPITFRKKFMLVLVLLDSSSKINAIHPTFVKKLGLPIRPTDVGVQKINGIMLDTFGRVVAAFSMTDKAN